MRRATGGALGGVISSRPASPMRTTTDAAQFWFAWQRETLLTLVMPPTSTRTSLIGPETGRAPLNALWTLVNVPLQGLLFWLLRHVAVLVPPMSSVLLALRPLDVDPARAHAQLDRQAVGARRLPALVGADPMQRDRSGSVAVLDMRVTLMSLWFEATSPLSNPGISTTSFASSHVVEK